MSKTKRFIAIATTLATVVWSMGMVIPAGATVISNGDLVKVAGSSAVYLIQGAQRRVFPHANVYHSWGYPADYSTVKTVTQSELNAYDEGNPVPFRDGSMFRGTATSFEGFDKTAVFYVENAKIRPVKSEEIYQALFNDPNWKLVTWVPDDLLSKFAYPQGSMIESADKHPDGCLIKYEGDDKIYLIQNGKKREITPSAIALNKLSNQKVLTVPANETYPDGTKISGVEEALVTPGWSEVVSNLTVALAYDTPSATNVPIAASNVPYTKVRLTNGNTAAKITSITVKRTGLGAAADFAKVGLFEGDVQLGSYKAISSSTDTAVFNLSNPLELAANQVRYLTIKATLTGSVAGHINKLGITAMTTDATVSGLPVYGNEMEAASITVGSVTPSYGSYNNLSPKIGEDDIDLAVIKLQADSKEDVEFRSIKLEQTGTARESDVSNVAIYYSSDKLGDCVWDRDYLTCVLDSPYLIKKGETREFKVKGNIEDGDTRTFKFAIEETYDVNAIGKSYGYPVTVANTLTPGVSQTVTISAGSVSINIKGPEAADITRDSDDVVLANLEITSNGESAELKKLYAIFTVTSDGSTLVNLTATDEEAKYLENVKLRDVATGNLYDGTLVASSYDASKNISGKYKFDSFVELEKGVKKTFEIRFDVPKKLVSSTYYPQNNATYKATISANDLDIKGDISGTTITEISPSSVSGNIMTVKTAGLTVMPVSLAAGKAVVNADGVLLYKGTLEATGEAIKVTSIKFEANATGSFDKDNVEHLYLYKVTSGVTGEQETLLKEATDAQFAGVSHEFAGLNLAVNPGSSNKVTFALRADISATLDASYKTLAVKIDETTADGVAAELVSDGTSLSDAEITITETAGRTVTLSGAGTLTLGFDINDSSINRDRYILAGTTTPWLGRIKLDAENEDVKIVDLVLTNINATAYDSVDMIELWNKDKTTKLAEVSWDSGSTVKFENLNYIVDDTGIDYLWVKASLKKIGTGAEDTADSGDVLRFSIADADASVKAIGKETGTTLARDTGSGLADGEFQVTSSNTSKTFTVVGARINNIVNAMSDGTLTSGTNTLAKYTISVDNSTNSTTSTGEALDVLLNELKVTFTLNGSGVTTTALSIERVGGVDGAKGSVSIVSNVATFNTDSLFTNDYKLKSGESATFVIKGTVGGLTTGAYSVETELDLTATPVWSDGITASMTGAKLDINTIDGAKLSMTF